MTLSQIIAANIKKHRKNAGISQLVLAQKCNTSTSYIGSIESKNSKRNMQISSLKKIADSLNVSIVQFLENPVEDDKDEEKQICPVCKKLAIEAIKRF